LGDAADLFVTEPGCAEELLRAFLRAADDRPGLGARPFEGLLDLGARGVRQLGRLVPCLLEQTGGPRLGLPDFLCGLLLRRLDGLTRLSLGRVQHLGPLALALAAVALDLAF